MWRRKYGNWDQIAFCLLVLQGASWGAVEFGRPVSVSYLPPRLGVYDRKTSILSPLHSPARRIWTTKNLRNIDFYLKFLAEYSAYKKWELIQLIFPENDPELCYEFRVFLLKQESITASCFYLGQNATSRDNFNKLFSFSVHPVVFCHFASENEKLSTNFSSALNHRVRLLIITGEYTNVDALVGRVRSDARKHYKWTLAMKVNSTHVDLEDIYGFATSEIPLRNWFGFWSVSKGLDLDRTRTLGPVDFGGRAIRCTTIKGPPIVVVQRLSNGSLTWSGFLPDLMESVSQHLNFEHSISTPPDGSFGREWNGNWSGMVGLLQREEMDIALMSLSFTANRQQIMDFSYPVEYSSNRLLIRKDWQNNELKWTAYTDPFRWEVWLMIPVTIALGVVAFTVFARYKLMDSTPAGSAWLLSLCFLQQGQEEHVTLRGLPCRLTLGCFWILAVILYASYTARLTSYLAANTDTLPVNSLEEAVNNYNWKIIVVKGTAVPDRIRDSKHPPMMKMWRRIQGDPSSYVGGSEEGIGKVYHERVIFFTVDLVPKFLIKGNCTFAWIPGKYFSGFGYMGYQKGLPFARPISQTIARLKETGQLRRLFRKWWGAASSCTEQSDKQGGFVGMSLYETGTAFLILLFGMLLSLIVIVMEIYVDLYLPILKVHWREKNFTPAAIFSGSAASAESLAEGESIPQPQLFR